MPVSLDIPGLPTLVLAWIEPRALTEA